MAAQRHKIFLSYSRDELYFAEAVAAALSREFDVWFDVQQLKPGLDWEAEIKRGHDTAEATVLLASRSSLHSPNVADEWEYVLAQKGRPIYLLVFENVSFKPYQVPGTARILPLDQLKAQAAGIIDCRRSYGRNIERLIRTLNAHFAGQDAAPKDRILRPITLDITVGGHQWFYVNVPTKYPLAVGAVAFALLCNIAMVILLTKIGTQFSGALLFAGILMTVILINQFFEFISRRFRYNQVRWTLFLAGLTAPGIVKGGFMPVILFADAIALLVMTFNRNLLFWSPRGQGPTLLRRGTRPFSNFGQRFKTTPTGKRYIIHSDPADVRIAHQIRSVMNRAGFGEGWVEADRATDIRFCVVSNMSRPEDFSAVAQTTDQLVWIVASPMLDVGPYTAFMNRQWVDFRNRDRIILRRMAEELRPDVQATAVSQLAVNVTPLDFRQQIVPGPINLLNFAIFFVGVTIAVFLGGGLIPAMVTSKLTPGAVIGTIIVVTVGIGLFLIMVRGSAVLLRREVGYRAAATLFFILTIMGAVATALVFFPLLVIPIVVAVLVLTSLRSWLPAGRFRSMPRHVDLSLWRRNAFIYGVIIFIIFGLFGRKAFAGTPEVDPAQIKYSRVSPVNGLSFDLPTHWLQAAVPDEESLHNFGVQTLDDSALNQFMNDANEVQHRDESVLTRALRNDMVWDALGSRSSLMWVALYEPVNTGGDRLILSVWHVNPMTDAMSLFQAKKKKFSLVPDRYTIRDDAPTGDGSTAMRCLRLDVNDPDTDVAAEWYCGVGAPAQAMIDIKVDSQIAGEQTPIIKHILSSLSVTMTF